MQAPADLQAVQEVVADKGYQSSAVVSELLEMGIRTYIPERKSGRRRWENKQRQQTAVYGNRRRIRGCRGKALLRKRGELVERSFEHVYDRGGMRRTHLRGHRNILKRLLIHVCGFNLGLLMRKLFGFGTPKGYQALVSALFFAVYGLPRVHHTRAIGRFSLSGYRIAVFRYAHAAA